MPADRLIAIRAIEALRCGVPNSAAVSLLGCGQPEVLTRFSEALETARSLHGKEKQPKGLIIQGGFGSGKSHTLRHLENVALERNFVCSKVSISKETPLYDPAKVYRQAMYSATLPDRRGAALHEIVSKIDFRSPAFEEFVHWVKKSACPHLAATLVLLQHSRSNRELVERITRFWSGDAMGVQEIRHHLATISTIPQFRFGTIRARDLALEKIRFAAKLIAAAGYAGWVILFDEIELIGCYGLLQRAKSYAEIGRFLGRLPSVVPGILAVFAVTDDFASAVLYGKNDLRAIPAMGYLGYKDGIPAACATPGMDAILRDAIPLRPPTPGQLQQTAEQVMQLYTEAYGWQPPALPVESTPTSTRIRQHLKRWIYRWDLARLCQVSETIELADVAMNYAETSSEETSSTEDELIKDLAEILMAPTLNAEKTR